MQDNLLNSRSHMVKHRHILGCVTEHSESQSTKISKISYTFSDNEIIFDDVVN